MTEAATKGRGARKRAPRRPSADRALDRVREILEETCVADGRPPNLQEVARRKAYRAGINRALAVIQAHESRTNETR